MRTFAAALIAASMLAAPAMAQAPIDGDTWITGSPPHVWMRVNGRDVDKGSVIDQLPSGEVHFLPTGAIPQMDAEGHLKWVTVCGSFTPEAIKQIKEALK